MRSAARLRRGVGLALAASALITGASVAAPVLTASSPTAPVRPGTAGPTGSGTAPSTPAAALPSAAAPTPPPTSDLVAYAIGERAWRPARTVVLVSRQIPPAAAGAYRRAAAIMRDADPDCALSWALLAAVGLVASDHGRRSGGHPLVDEAGLPVADTDAGEVDGDTVHDRAVGPLALSPSTWSTVRVDADGDGRRHPGDIDDAALASAVVLCGTSSLKGRAQVTAGLAHLNAAPDFAPLVVKAAASYRAAGVPEPPDVAAPPTVAVPSPAPRWAAEAHPFEEDLPEMSWMPAAASPWGRAAE